MERFEIDKKIYIPQPGDKLVGQRVLSERGFSWEYWTIERPSREPVKGRWEIDPYAEVDPNIGRPTRRWVPESKPKYSNNDWADRRENSRFGSMG